MKQAILQLKERVLLVELPEGFMVINKELNSPKIKVPNIKKEIGKLIDMTESQFEILVPTNGVTGYYNYLTGVCSCDMAEESFYSKLAEDEIWFDNPYGEEPFVPYYASYGMTMNEYQQEVCFAQHKLDEWQEAQDKVWDKNNTYVFLLTNKEP